MTLRLAIDGENFAHDRRGMGRFARAVAAVAIADPDLAVTLLYRKAASARTLQTLFEGGSYTVGHERSARSRRRYGVCWFPWNGMRYATGAPAVVTIHDTFAFSEPARGAVARFREQHPIERAARQAKRLIFVSDWSAAQGIAALALDPVRTAVVPEQPAPFFTPGPALVPLPQLEGKRYVLFVSGTEARKNAATIFEASARALHRARETLVIVGPLARADTVRLHAYRVPHVRVNADDTTLRALYRAASIVAVPSVAEGFGLVAAEAMACGAPVIAADAAALPQTCGGAALLRDPRDAGGWAQAIRALLDDRALRDRYAALSSARWDGIDRLAFAHDTIATLKACA